MADSYTHIFDFNINGSFLRGECEFNTDGQASYKFTETSEPLPHDSLKHYSSLMALIDAIYKSAKKPEDVEIKKILIEKKEVVV